MATSQPIRVAIIGTAKRPSYLYGPLLKGLPEEVGLVAVWGRNTGAVRQLGKSLGTPQYTARTDEIVHVFRPCRPLIGAKRR
jgi:predicted dehydrogenase